MGQSSKAIKKVIRRSNKLYEKDVESISELISKWPGQAPTWNEIIDKVKSLTQQEYTRQALSRHNDIAVAFDTRRKGADQEPRRPRGSVGLQIANDKIDALKGENEFLKAINRQFKEQYVRWIINAYAKGLTIEALDGALVAPKRGSLHKEED